MAKATDAGGTDAAPKHSAPDARVELPPPPLGLARLTLGQRLWLVLGVFLVFWAGHVGLAAISTADVKQLTGVVDDAGRLRMLSQRIVLEAQAAGGPPAERTTRVDSLRREAEAVLDRLETAGLALAAQQYQPRIRALIASLRQDWRRLGGLARQTINDATVATRALSASRSALLMAERLVQQIRAAQARRQQVIDWLRIAIHTLAGLLLVFVGVSFHRAAVRPLRALGRMAMELQRGHVTKRVHYPTRDEIGQLAGALNHSASRIESLMNELSAERDALAEKSRQETLLFENAADGLLIVDTDTTIVRANREAERIFGYAPGTLTGRPLAALIPEAQRAAHRRWVQDYLAHPRVRDMSGGLRIRGRCCDASTVPVDVRLSPVQLGGRQQVMAAVRDVSAQRRAEVTRDRLAGILEATSDLVLVFRPGGRLLHANPAARAALDLNAHDLEGRTIDSLLTDKARRRLHELAIPEAKVRGRWEGILSFRPPRDGHMIPVSAVLVGQHVDADALDSLSLIARDISAELRHKRELEYQATHDALTRLPNRTVFEDRLNQELCRAHRHQTVCAVAFVDVDNFKLVNDSLGHAAGDELLRILAQRLRELARASDTVVRFGGDEFALVLPDIGNADHAARLAVRLLEGITRPVIIQGQSLALTMSVGLALYPDHGADAETLTMRADAAMFRAKERGRNRFAVYDPAQDSDTGEMHELNLRAALPAALARGELTLHYQPLVDAGGSRTTGVEALIRWRRPEGLFSAAQFIPAAERQGLMGELCAWTLHRACQQAMRWIDAGLELDYIAVNISATQIHDDSLTASVIDALDRSGLPPAKLELELTETAVLEYHEQAALLFNRLRALGVRLAIDDFGAGYSGLPYLASLPVDRIKLDRSLTSQCDQHHLKVLLQAIIDMAHQLGATATAEGIETPAQARILRLLGCDELQGFHFFHPMPAEGIRLGTPTNPGQAAGQQ